MILTKTRLSIIVDTDEEHLVNSNLQYSLTLIESSLDYLRLINTELITEKKSAIMRKLISLTNSDELNKLLCSKEMLKELLKDHERIISLLRKSFEKYRDREEANFITTIIEKHQSIARKLRRCF
ncbi:MAG: hypothetical protein Q8L90_16935 [Bacteroidota bacterium]|nr:hypothetical protein [Bacteroidota bacterium]